MPDRCLELLGQKEPAPELAGRYVDSTDVGGKITTAAGGQRQDCQMLRRARDYGMIKTSWVSSRAAREIIVQVQKDGS